MRIKPIICKLGSDAVGSICDYESATIAFITAVSKFKVPADCKRRKHTEIYERLALSGGVKAVIFIGIYLNKESTIRLFRQCYTFQIWNFVRNHTKKLGIL